MVSVVLSWPLLPYLDTYCLIMAAIVLFWLLLPHSGYHYLVMALIALFRLLSTDFGCHRLILAIIAFSWVYCLILMTLPDGSWILYEKVWLRCLYLIVEFDCPLSLSIGILITIPDHETQTCKLEVGTLITCLHCGIPCSY